MPLKLYEFAISHYCEKVRWALDFKGINYSSQVLLPGQHVKTVQQLGAPASSVPVLEHNGTIVQGSADILTYLDEHFPENSLTPSDPQQKDAALEWERRMDEELGPAIRCYLYHYFLQRPKVVVPLFTAGTPFYNGIFLKLVFSRMDELMRKWMKINEKTADKSRQIMEAYLQELCAVYEKQEFLVGDQFSRADLTAAAFFAPLFQPPQYPVPWPKPSKIPAPVNEWMDTWQTSIQKFDDIYEARR